MKNRSKDTLKGNKKNSTQLQNIETKKSPRKKVIIIILLVALALSAYFFIFNKSEKDEKPKVENSNAKEKPAEKNIQDSIKKNESSQKVDNKYIGKYVSAIDPASYRELKADGTFFAKDGPMKGGGTYSIDSNVITFKYDVGLVASSKIIANMIIDEDREVWNYKK